MFYGVQLIIKELLVLNKKSFHFVSSIIRIEFKSCKINNYNLIYEQGKSLVPLVQLLTDFEICSNGSLKIRF